MTLDNLELALKLNNQRLLAKIKEVKDSMSGATDADLTDINKAIQENADNIESITESLNDYAKSKDLHNHQNKSVLDEISDSNGSLTYKGNVIQMKAILSKDTDNALVNKSDGLYVKDYSTKISSLEKSVLAISKELNQIGSTVDTINRTVI